MGHLLQIILIMSTFHLSAVGGQLAKESIPETTMTPTDTSPAPSRYTRPISPVTMEGVIDSRLGGKIRREKQLPRLLGRSQEAATGREIQVIPANAADEAKIATLSRDLRVMLHILEKKRSVGYGAAGYTYYRNDGRLLSDLGQILIKDDRTTKALYVEGFGALFFMEVSFPVQPLPASDEQDTNVAEDALDLTWKRAERELFLPEGYNVGDLAPTITFDAEAVAGLKTELINRLKHAANIRGMGPDNWVIVTVYGGCYLEMPGEIAYYPSALTIRAKKLDIDAFAKGDLNVAQFRDKVQVLTYTPSDSASLSDRQTAPRERKKPLPPGEVVSPTR